MSKKIVALALVIITLVSTFAITASAASYSTGTYTVSASSGINVRKGSSTNYAKVGAASKGTKFVVSKVVGNWGYTSSIKCTNGTRSGWVSLNYCTYKGSTQKSRATYNEVFASLKGSGYSLSQGRNSQATSFKKGDFVYAWGYLHDGSNNLYRSYGSGTCNLTISIYRPNGSLAHTYTYKNSDNNWIGCKLDQVGTWKIQSKVTGALTGTNTRSITVKESSSPSYYTLTYNANGGYGAPSYHSVKANTGFYLRSSKPTRSGYTFLGWSTNKNATYATYAPGKGVKINSNVTLYAVWKSNVINPTSVSLSSSSCTLWLDEAKQLYAWVSPSNATNQTVSWSSSNSSVASVSGNGRVYATYPGVAKITARTSNGKTATCTVTVKGIKITGDYGYETPKVGDVYYLRTTSYPSASKIKWSSTNSKVVAVNSSGKITAKAAGNATITAKTNDGRSYSVYIKVSNTTEWRTGRFDDGYVARGYTTVKLNKNAGNGYIRIHTYNAFGNRSSGEIHVTLRDSNGNWIREFDASSGQKLLLGNNYSQYRVYIAKKRYPDTIFGQSDNFLNTADCVNWAIECDKNTYIA